MFEVNANIEENSFLVTYQPLAASKFVFIYFTNGTQFSYLLGKKNTCLMFYLTLH
jgi:hypothetical protein